MNAVTRRFRRGGVMLIGLVLALLTVVPAANADIYDPADWAPMVWSDKADYAPGERVTLNGAHWQPGETVHIRVNDDTGASWDRDVDVTADDVGGITDQFNLPDWFVAQYRVTATGASGAVATHTFTDSNYYVKNASTTPAGVAVSYKIETFSSKDCTGTGTVKFSGTLTGPNAASAQAIDQDTGSVRYTYVGATGGYGFDVWKLDNHAPGSGGANDGDPVTGGGSTTICDVAKNGGTVTYVGFSKQAKQDQTITFPALANRTYGDADAQLNATTSSGLQVGYSASGACSINADKVHITGAGSCTVTASQAGNANFNAANSVDRSFTIAKAPLSVKANDATRKYGDANPGFTGAITGVKNNDAISATYSAPATTSSNVGNYPIVPQVVATAAVLANYETPVLNNGTLTVGKAPLSVKADDKTRVYGDANPELTGTLTGVKNNDAVTASYSTTADKASGVGTYAITAHVDGQTPVLDNYDVTRVDGTLSVGKAPLSVKANDASREYGAGNPEFSGVITGVKNGDEVKAEYSSSATLASKVGSYPIVPKVVAASAVLANYETPAIGNGTLTVGKAPLSVKADDRSKVYGDANPVLTGTLTGVKNQDAVTASYSTAADEKTGVGDHKIVADVAGEAGVLTNYDITRVDGTLKITRAPLSVKADDKTKVYGDVNPTFTGELTGVKNNDAVTTSFSTTADQKSGVGDYVIAAHADGTEAVLANYEVELVDGKLTVTKAPLSVKANDASREYGDQNPEFSGVITGIKNGGEVKAEYSSSATPGSRVGSYPIVPKVVATDAVLANYEAPVLTNGILEVTKAPLSVKADDKTKVYGDANPELTGELTGVKNGDAVTKRFSTVADEKSGVGEYVIAARADGEAAVLANYEVELVDGKLTVTKAPLSVKANDASREYGDQNPEFSGVITGIKNGDEVKAEYSSSATPASRVGSYPIVPKIVATDAVLANYEAPVLTNGTLEVTKAPLSVKADNKTKVYGDANPELTGEIEGVKNGDLVTPRFSTEADKKSGVGKHKIAAHADGEDAVLANYEVKLVDGTLEITKAPLSVKADNKTKVYGDDNPELTGELTGVKNNDHVTASYSTTADKATGAGNHKIAAHADGEDAVLANYEVKLVDGTLEITKAPLSVKADNKTKVYGDGNPELTGELTGVKNNDSVTASYSTDANEKSGVGDYKIAAHANGSEAMLANYDVELIDGKLTVIKAPLTVTAHDATREYGDKNPEFTGELTGVKNSDAVTATYSSDADEKSGVGEYKVVGRANGTGAVLANYEVELVDGKLTVTQAPLSVKADDKTKVYGDANPVLTGKLDGVKNGDAVTTNYSTIADEKSGVGDYVIVAEIVATQQVLANYQAPELGNGKLTVTKAPLSLKADDKTKVYGDTNPELTGKLDGVKNGDEVKGEYSTAVDQKTGVGAYPIVARIVAADAVLDNYKQPVLNDGTLTVTKAPLSVKANDAARLLGAQNPVFTGTITGVKNGDAVTASYSTPATTASPVGTYPIVPQVVGTAAVLANYEDPVLTSGTLTITYRWDGFLQPINDTGHQTGAESKFKLGQTIPAKFVIKNASGAVVTQATNPTFTRSTSLGACDPNTVAENVAEDLTPAAGGTYNWDGGKYHYNWSTKGLTAGEYRIYANLADGTKRFVDICLTK